MEIKSGLERERKTNDRLFKGIYRHEYGALSRPIEFLQQLYDMLHVLEGHFNTNLDKNNPNMSGIQMCQGPKCVRERGDV